MTDPDTADRTYVEPITVEAVSQVIERERPDALLPNMGGQTALNCTVALGDAGVLEKYGVEVIGCNLDSIRTGEDRELFAQAMQSIGLDVARSGFAHTLAEAEAIAEDLGFPVVIRPSFTLGGAGGGMAYDMRGLREIVEQGPGALPGARGARGAERRGLEGDRDGGDARPDGQRHHHLLDREPRPHGRAHRRLHHRRARPDAQRRGDPAPARLLPGPSWSAWAWPPAAPTCSSP